MQAAVPNRRRQWAWAALALGLLVCAPLRAQQADEQPSGPAVADAQELSNDSVQQLLHEIPFPQVAPPAAAPEPSQARRPVEAKYDISKIGERGIGKGVNMYSLQREMALGQSLAAQVEYQAKLITDPMVNDYVNRIGQNLVRNSDARVPFTIKVIDNEEVNAFALPGGFFYVNSGLIMAADNEAQLAGVMAHEIAHVAARHGTRNATKSQIFNLVSIPLIFMGGPAGVLVREASGLAVPVSFLKFSRDMEREADLLGLQYMYVAGYDPAEFVNFFETLRVKGANYKKGFMARVFATHPMTEDRIKAAQDEIETMLPPKSEYLISTNEFDDVKAHLMEVTNHMRLNPINGGSPDRPTLMNRTSMDAPATVEDTAEDGPPTLAKEDGQPTLAQENPEEGRPTLHRSAP